MKRLLIIALMLMVGVGAASAQKKEVVALGEEVAQLKAREAELQRQVDSLARVCSDNKYIMEQLATMNTAYESLKSAYADVTESMKTLIEAYAAVSADVKGLSANVNELVISISNMPAQAPAEAAKPKYEVIGKLACGMAMVKEGLLFGYINTNGDYVIPAQFEEAKDFLNNHAYVRKNDKWGVISNDGNVIIPCEYDQVNLNDDSKYKVLKSNKWGVINNDGNVIIPCEYDQIGLSGGSNYWVEKGEKQGLLSRDGKVIIACEYDGVERYNGSLYVVKKSDKYGLLSISTGTLVQPIKYDAISYLSSEGRALMRLNDKYGYFDENGKVVIPAKYCEARDFDEEKTRVQETYDTRWYYIDINGNFVHW